MEENVEGLNIKYKFGHFIGPVEPKLLKVHISII